jgi:AcrR family transcriptional regulator/DNA-binding MarR family transcriptional regulator
MAGARRARSSARDGVARAPQAYNGTVRAQLGELQRARIIGAMLDVATERGASSVSVAHVVERSGVSRRTFYELFTDREDCFLAAFEQALSYASQRVIPAHEAEKAWRERIRAGLVALLSFLDEEPRMGRVLIAESLAGGPRTLARRSEVIAQLTSIVEQGAAQGKSSFTPSPLTGEGVVGGVLAVIQARLAEQSHAPLVELTNPLMSMIVLPYMGAGAARRELQRSTPKPSSEGIERTLLGDPFKDAGMRLTYRTVRVLMAIAEHPGASNRLIADTAEIKDQGQVSKLLGRLQRAGMVSNTGLGPGQGAPNAWTLTASGRQVTESIRTHTEGYNHRRVT